MSPALKKNWGNDRSVSKRLKMMTNDRVFTALTSDNAHSLLAFLTPSSFLIVLEHSLVKEVVSESFKHVLVVFG